MLKPGGYYVFVEHVAAEGIPCSLLNTISLSLLSYYRTAYNKNLFPIYMIFADGTILRFVQGILDPLQQIVADGCHLTRNTGTDIARAGFKSLDINQASVSTLSIISPHVYGIARR